ncbi:hypothetical protein [Paraburkholderia adhaesiva]|uniref:hypothetical protein n=1 Tax=Paraburkholderia adhaesiva TaxID=2883244 RepID=UPI001F2B4A2B|nr:hypothetical protein [Paraburkholderia adhaesiva]
MDINDVIAVVDSEAAASLCLSKGGWEGWLQCELWSYLTTTRNESPEREVAYPGRAERCDLVVMVNGVTTWVEIKAYGIFREGDTNRFLDSIGLDIMKLNQKPAGTQGLSLVVVQSAIRESFQAALQSRHWNGFNRTDAPSGRVSVYHMTF